MQLYRIDLEAPDLANLLGTQPPANVPTLEENSLESQPMTMLEAMEEHRRNAVCASCHKLVDPPGFASDRGSGPGDHP